MTKTYTAHFFPSAIFAMLAFVGTGQSFLNGSFETTSASMACNYNLANGTFNSLMSNVTAYGAGNECDILINGCYVVGIPDGVRAVGIAGTQDEIAMALSGPLTAGASYTINFWTRSDVNFRPQGNVQVGASTANNTFGTLIYTAVTVPSTWVNHTVTFVAPNNATHITVRNVPGVIHWNHIDHFTLVSPLPIELMSFEAENFGPSAVSLRWETAREINNDYFTIERSSDGALWEEILEVDGAGTTDAPRQYQSVDEHPMIGINYYRLRQTDFNGEHTFSETQSVNIDEGNSIRIYPNPTRDRVTVVGDAETWNTVSCYSLTGQDLSHKISMISRTDSTITLDLSALAAGSYTIKTASAFLRIEKL